MTYPAVEVKAWYDTRMNNMDIGLTFLNTMLKSISDDNLDTTGTYIKPKKEIIKEIKNEFSESTDKNKVQKEAQKPNSDDYAGIREFEVIVGIVYLDDDGEINHFAHFKEYKVIGPSQRRIRSVFGKK